MLLCIWLILHVYVSIVYCEGEHTYLGCYTDYYADRALPDLVSCESLCYTFFCSNISSYCQTDSMTVDFCVDLCKSKQFKYAGLQAGSQCFCGSMDALYSKHGESQSNCTTPCTGNSSQVCGDSNRNSVYDTLYEPSGCPQPDPIVNGTIETGEKSEYFQGDSIIYFCEGMRLLLGEQNRTCLASGMWDNPSPECRTVCNEHLPASESNRGTPVPVEEYNNSISVEGEQYFLPCLTGYTSTSESLLAACQSDGTWHFNSTDITCEAVVCDTTVLGEGVIVVGNNFTYSSTVIYTCDVGYMSSSGSTTRQCQADGTWSGMDISCNLVSCVPPQITDGMTLSPAPGPYYYGDVVTYYCVNQDATLVGDSMHNCTANGTWSGQQPVCQTGCGEFSFGSSHYEVNFVETTVTNKTWSEIRDMCVQSGYQLVSITTSDENEAILNFLENCTHGDYAIGLSRQMGMPRMESDSWNWQSGETAMNDSLWGSGHPNVSDAMCAVVYMTTMMDGKWYDISCSGFIGLTTGYGYICERSMIATTQLSTTAGEVQHSISDVQITKASSDEENNDELDLIMIVLASASPVLVIVILLLLYKFRERLCCKSNSKTNPGLMMDIVKDRPMTCETLINSKNECCDIDSANKGSIYYSIVLDNDRPSISTANTTGQGKNPGSNNIQVQSMNTSSDNSRQADTYHMIQSRSTHDREHPHDYESEENPNYDRYQEEEMGLIYAEITNESEGEVENPAYDALPFESESLYASADKTPNVAGSGDVGLLEETGANVPVDDNDMVDIDALYAKPDMNKTRKYKVQSPDNFTIRSETESNNASLDKTTDVVVSLSGDMKETGAIVAPVDDNGIGLVDDSNIDALYAKPDMNKRRKHEVEGLDNTLPSETESNYASPDKMTDVLVSGDVKETGAIVAPVDNNDIGLVDDSNIDSLYAKPDMNKTRRHEVEGPDNNTLPSETESNNYASSKTDVVGSGDV